MKLIKGADLSLGQRLQVQAAYVNWIYDTTVKTFSEWIVKKAFYFTSKGELSRRNKFCVPAYMADEEE